jgi:cation/acetate symporter
VGLYAGIGIMSRTSDTAEYYVAGRRVPAVYNGMATGADWMSAASFIGMAGTLYLHRLRRPGLHHGLDGRLLPGGAVPGACTCASSASSPSPTSSARVTAATCLASWASWRPSWCPSSYVVAQIYGVGLITARLTGLDFLLGRVRGPGRHPGVLVPGRHARGDLDAGGAVHHPDRGLHDPGGVAVGEAHRHPRAAAHLRPAACRR